MTELLQVSIDYTNHAGVRAIRQIIPTPGGLRFGSTQWHHDKQWLLDAYDVEKDDVRTFAVKDIHSWAPANSASGRSMASFAKQLQQSIEKNSRMSRRISELQSHYQSEASITLAAALAAILKDEDPVKP